MKKEVTLVPKDKCPLDIIVAMGTRASNAWIFLHSNAIDKLKENCEKFSISSRYIRLYLNATEEIPIPTIKISNEFSDGWNPVVFIDSKDIYFKHRSNDPEEIIFIKMEE